MGGWKLQKFTMKFRCHGKKGILSNMIHRISTINWLLSVIAGCGYPEYHFSNIFLFLCLIVVNLFGHFTCAQNQQSGCQWIQGASMSYFFNFNCPSYFFDYIKRSPMERLIY